MQIAITPTCRVKIERLSKKSKTGYSSCLADITSFFKELPFDIALKSNRMIFRNEQFQISKFRIASSSTKDGKSSGYRAIILFDFVNKINTLIEFYPKFGPAAMTSLVPGWQKIIIPEYHQALQGKCIDFEHLSSPEV
jgi:mRNA-degrading endonuclease RelE of RelBE toxin-antitoxin system